MLPAEWIAYLGGKKNDDMLFNKMNFIFVANMLMNSAWLPVFQSNSQWGFIVGWVLLVGIWMTNTAMMVISQRTESWWLEALLVRVPFSVYSGWVTCATVLNTVYMFMSWGAVDSLKFSVGKNNGNGWWSWLEPIMFINQNEWTIVIEWTLMIFFEIVAWWERNPVWGGVLAWAGSAILNNQIDKLGLIPDDSDDISFLALLANSGVIVGFHAFSMALLFVYLIFE